jgi:predicted Rossmann fold flavoprotein
MSSSGERIVVIGGGAAGFFSAIHLAEGHPEARVTILERGKSVLEKVRISGGGRCNVTHACWDPRELTRFYPRGGKELLGPFHKFACGDTMGWFDDRGVELKIEEDGRVFPVSDDSQTIINCLTEAARRKGVAVITMQRVTEITAPKPPNSQWIVRTKEQVWEADRLVVTTGSNPAVWKLLARVGHTIVDPVPSLFAFNIRDPRIAELAGISLPWVQIHVVGDRLKAEGPLLITHKGLSGPAVLRLSAWGARQLHPLTYRFEIAVNWVAQRAEDVGREVDRIKREEARRQVGSQSRFDLPLRLWQALVTAAGIPADQQWAQLRREQREALLRQLIDARFRVNGKATNKEEFTTAGGVDLREVDFRDFRSKLHPTLHLAGEVLDIDAITGGFNFQAAWTGGYLIGSGGN